MAAELPSDLARVDPSDAWKPWRPTAATPWDRKWASHLFRRAAFGPSPADTERALADGFEKTLDRLLTGEPDAAAILEVFTDTGRYLKGELELRVWWLSVVFDGGHPLREKLTLFWHNHFATSIAKVQRSQLMLEQNLTLRSHALGKFRPFLLEMSRDTAMLKWLDSNRNTKGAPNENYAREVMELFSLGVGNYTEKDIQEAARAFTGWHVDAQPFRSEDTFQFKPVQHDTGPKTIFGKTGNWGGEDVIQLCCDQPACARFIVRKLYDFLVSEAPPPKGLLAPLEDRYRASDYDTGELVKTMLGSRLFFSPHAYRKRVKWPIEYAVGAVRAVVPGRAPPADLIDPLAKMGQALFAPPNVKGWRTGTDWLNSATLLARNNFAETVATGTWPRTSGRSSNSGAVRTVAVKTEVAAAAGATAEAPAPAPDAPFDTAAALFDAKPAGVKALVKRMGEVLLGEDVAPAARAKIESFLLDGRKTMTAKEMDNPAFKQRTREAVHALMCLPEYQLS